jgi:transcriptional regulator with XRE-family HTH domain
MTDSFGARLRRERERRQVGLADIAARTKIKASLFEAIERDDASRWPSGIFRRSFMRAYAEAIGLDGDATVREFLERFPDPAAPAPPDAAAAVTARASAKPAALLSSADRGTPAAAGSTSLRLTLVETGLPFTGGRFLADAKRRWSAAAWDLGSLVAIAVSIFIFMDAFWMPLGVTALCYYVGGILFLGNSPGVCLFAPRPEEGGGGGVTRPARVPRHRPVEATVRTAEPAFRASRFRAERHREVRT